MVAPAFVPALLVTASPAAPLPVGVTTPHVFHCGLDLLFQITNLRKMFSGSLQGESISIAKRETRT
jgi:hypothetical protein